MDLIHTTYEHPEGLIWQPFTSSPPKFPHCNVARGSVPLVGRAPARARLPGGAELPGDGPAGGAPDREAGRHRRPSGRFEGSVEPWPRGEAGVDW